MFEQVSQKMEIKNRKDASRAIQYMDFMYDENARVLNSRVELFLLSQGETIEVPYRSRVKDISKRCISSDGYKSLVPIKRSSICYILTHNNHITSIASNMIAFSNISEVEKVIINRAIESYDYRKYLSFDNLVNHINDTPNAPMISETARVTVSKVMIATFNSLLLNMISEFNSYDTTIIRHVLNILSTLTTQILNSSIGLDSIRDILANAPVKTVEISNIISLNNDKIFDIPLLLLSYPELGKLHQYLIDSFGDTLVMETPKPIMDMTDITYKSDKYVTIYDVASLPLRSIDHISTVEKFISSTNRVKKLGCLKLSAIDILRLSNMKGVILYKLKKVTSEMYFIAHANELFIVSKIGSAGSELIRLNYIVEDSRFVLHQDITTVKYKELTLRPDLNRDIVGEAANSIVFDEDAYIKFKFRAIGNNCYMNEYSRIHMVLKENFKHKNFEAMKTDIARMYSLIMMIEDKVVYYRGIIPISAAKRSDGMKARMFAINDFKRYLQEVIIYDPKFNFTDFYLRADTVIKMEKEYDIKISAIGVRKLFTSL